MPATLEELRLYEAEIQKAQGQLSMKLQALGNSLAHVRIRMVEMENINRNALTYNLPNEILSAIFEAGLSCSRYNDDVLDRSIISPQIKPKIPFEMLVSAVSRRWRNIALQSPRLWANIHINISTSTEHLFHLYLHRSKMCLLDIMVEQTAPLHRCDPHVKDSFKRHLARLVLHVGRWRKFVIAFFPLSEALFPLVDLRAPALETLVVNSYHNSEPTIELFSGGTPLLSSVELYGGHFQLPCESVKSLKLGLRYSNARFSLAGFSRFLLPMRSLTHLTLFISIHTETSADYSSIILPCVLSLEFHISYTIGVGVLAILDLPAVETVVIHGDTEPVIKAFTQQNQPYPSLRSLTIISEFRNRGPDILPNRILEFISLFPDIRNVAFHGADATCILHTLRNQNSPDELLWPHLSAITVVPTTRATISYKKQIWAYMIKLVTNRIRFGNPLECITVSSKVLERSTQRQQQQLRDQVTLIEC